MSTSKINTPNAPVNLFRGGRVDPRVRVYPDRNIESVIVRSPAPALRARRDDVAI